MNQEIEGKFDREAIRRFWTVARLFFISEQKWTAIGFVCLLAVFLVSMNGIDVLLSYVNRDFMTALSLREKDEFFEQLYKYLLMFSIATPVVVLYRYAEERFDLVWRDWLNRKLIDSYFTRLAYYTVNWDERIDNPDQRIAEDIRTFTTTTVSLSLILFKSIISIFLFVGILWSISTNLVIAVFIYAAFGSLTAYFLGRPLISLNFSQLRKEANYRYKLISVRDNVESIAFHHGEKKEAAGVQSRFRELLRNMRKIIDWNRNLNFFITFYNYLKGILPIIIVAPLYLEGKIEFGVVTQSIGAFMFVLDALSIIVQNFAGLSSLAAVTQRLGSFWDLVIGAQQMPVSGQAITIEIAPSISIKDLSLRTPKYDQLLVNELNLELAPKERLLITGPSGSGKSSILRALAGLWSTGRGFVKRPELKEMMFIPQRPYMILGPFRSQFLYSVDDRKPNIGEDDILAVLKELDLETTVQRVGGFDSELDWPNILSLGEQQRIAFARILLVKPRFVILDEASTAIEQETEERLYALLREFTENIVSVGLRTNLLKYHSVVLSLMGNGKWRIERK